ncbi:MAG: ROK family protein [Bifidobacteriaceae bacterium]|nr:ROK family protein [Bifidobacteriaceae bacterium]
MKQDNYIGIDVGGTKIEGVVCNINGDVSKRYKVLSRPGNGNVIADILHVVSMLSEEPTSIGIGIPGTVDNEQGIVQSVVNLDVDMLPLREKICEVYDARVCVENDVNAAAYGAYISVKKEYAKETVAFLNLGTGLATGVVQAGILNEGTSGAVGEIGHLPVDKHGFPCICGQSGCLETVCSGAALAKLWPEVTPPMPDILTRAAKGEVKAKEVLSMFLHAVGDALQIIVQTFDPHIILVGGGISRSGELLLQVMQDEMRARASHSDFLRGLAIDQRIRLVDQNIPIGAIGAALAHVI